MTDELGPDDLVLAVCPTPDEAYDVPGQIDGVCRGCKKVLRVGPKVQARVAGHRHAFLCVRCGLQANAMTKHPNVAYEAMGEPGSISEALTELFKELGHAERN